MFLPPGLIRVDFIRMEDAALGDADRWKKKLSVALIVGGRSTRMGRDKACLMDGTGQELWRRQLDLLHDLGAAEVLISCRPDQSYLEAAAAQLVFDRWDTAGPLGGILSCFEATATERLLVLAVDLPGMTRQVLEALALPQQISGLVFQNGGHLEPLAAVYPRAMVLSGHQRLAAGQLSLQKWIVDSREHMQVLELPASWKSAFINVNDPAGWAAWQGSA